MSNWNILIADGLHPAGLAILRARAQADDRKGISANELMQTIRDYHAIIVRSRTKISAETLETAGKLRVVGRAGVGVDNIDLSAAANRGVTVVNAPLATTLAVAEQTLGLMLAMARSIPRADTAMKSGQWIKKELMGVELNGKILGIAGVGNIGSAVAERARALGMHALGFDPLLSDEALRSRGVEPTDLHDLYERSDFISLHVPLRPETRNMVDGQALGRMKRGVRLICTARGGVIDETALLGALESGQVAGAALDVFAQEPPGLSALVAHPNVIATPHVSSQTQEAQQRAAEDIANEVLAALDGKPLRWKVV